MKLIGYAFRKVQEESIEKYRSMDGSNMHARFEQDLKHMPSELDS